jgi:hypothetical protein
MDDSATYDFDYCYNKLVKASYVICGMGTVTKYQIKILQYEKVSPRPKGNYDPLMPAILY